MSRPRLLELVTPELADDPPITLLRGPAGSGKTTLLADWALHQLNNAGAAVCWVALAGEDNDVFTLWSSILSALERSGAWSSHSALQRLEAPHGQVDAEFLIALAAVFREASHVPVILILDDLHQLVNRNALASIDLLLRHLPDRLRLVIATRFDPPIAIPRLRLEGKLRDIDGKMLAFTEREADGLLRVHRLKLSEADLRLLLRLTEGWAAGLRLAGMSLIRMPEDSPLPADFTADDRTLADYLVGEVLSRQEPQMRGFLLATCVCDQVTVELARLLSGRENAGALLDDLERTNSFVARQGYGRYRYHPMLRAYFRAELNRMRPDLAPQLHALAATWFKKHGETLTAIDHAVHTGDPQLLATLLRADGLRHITEGDGARVRQALARAGSDLMAGQVPALIRAAAELDALDPAAALEALALAARSDVDSTAASTSAQAAGLTLAIRALDAVILLQRARFLSRPLAARSLLQGDETAVEGADLDQLISLERGVSRFWLGELDAAREEIGRVLDLASTERRDWMVAQSLAGLARIAAAAGDLNTAQSRAEETLRLTHDRGWNDSRPAAEAQLVLGWLAYQRLDDDTAVRLTAELGGARPADPDRLALELLQVFTRFGVSEDRHAEVALVRDLWRERGPRHVQPHLLASASIIEQQMALAVGEVQWAIDVADRAQRLLGDTAETDLLRAVVQVHLGRPRLARQLLNRLLAGEVTSMSSCTDVEAWLWEARLASRIGETQSAETALIQALARAAPSGLLRPLQRGGPEVAELLTRMAGRFGHHEAFAARARTALETIDSTTDSRLTTRELELLTQLPSMQTAEEIAASYYLSVNTVKTHIRGIYRKLGVSNRRDAVMLARRRGLI